MKELLNKGKAMLSDMPEKVSADLASGFQFVKEKVNGLPIFMSVERTSSNSAIRYDEKHYFVVPFALSEHGFALHTLRNLPEGVPEVNDLPKRRVFHFPTIHSEAMLRKYMVNCAAQLAIERTSEDPNSLHSLADQIDALDRKLTYGMLLIGGVAALSNPLLGAGIAAKALLPGVAGIVSKFTLRPAAQKLTDRKEVEAIRQAEENVLREFGDANTVKVINPILQQLDLALRTTQSQHDPLLDFNFSTTEIKELHGDKWQVLTEIAMYHVYKDVYHDPLLYNQAQLGPEDIRWFDVLFSNIEKS
ncbi:MULTISPECIES: hypothetical protein [unclassified Pseudoalteromonas]|uniref:hypothetical protein n=1 Tax=unclassified Pseudoalteromonas TaxID=194690 RepID=UPI0020981B51|nr:hypothetical protein [Pseudoalteromonas sp. XMcav2-N]MCO7187769.1 hypothetical protein [Pseudoalteromonas sp. XMcav2-N]